MEEGKETSKCVCERNREKVQKSMHMKTRRDRRCNPVYTEDRSCKYVKIIRENAISTIIHHFLKFSHSLYIKYRGYINDKGVDNYKHRFFCFQVF